MPAIFDNGMWACGRGAIAWGRGKTVLGRLEKAGPACILDQQHVVCQAFHKGRWQVVAIDVAGGEVRIVSTRGATELVAQGGKWARLLGNDMTTGTLLGETRTYTNAAPVDVAIDGRIGYKRDISLTASGSASSDQMGRPYRISDTVARDVAVVPGRDAAVWARTNGLGAAGIAVVSVLGQPRSRASSSSTGVPGCFISSHSRTPAGRAAAWSCTRSIRSTATSSPSLEPTCKRTGPPPCVSATAHS